MSDMLESMTLAGTDVSQEVLVFRLGDEEYAVDILKVQEIRGYGGVTRIPNAPSFIKGVTNLRGSVVPIVDLRIKFRLESLVYDAHTVVIVLNIGARLVGVVVDSVSDVVTLTAEQIVAAPDFGSAVATRFVAGLATLEERMLILVDIEAMMSSDELALIDDTEAASAID